MVMSQELGQGDCSPPEAPWVWSPSRADVCTPLGPVSSTLPCDRDTCSPTQQRGSDGAADSLRLCPSGLFSRTQKKTW